MMMMMMMTSTLFATAMASMIFVQPSMCFGVSADHRPRLIAQTPDHVEMATRMEEKKKPSMLRRRNLEVVNNKQPEKSRTTLLSKEKQKA
jgi:hypothetical protein